LEYQGKREKEREAEEREFGGAGNIMGGGSSMPQSNPIASQSQQKNNRNATGGEGSGANAGAAPGVPDLFQIVGYMPKRGDFDQEYDADADTLLADLEYFDDDTEHDIKLKNDVIELYNARIDERIRRKKFVLERGLLDFKRTQK
jgi:hypothetical protein